MITIETYRNMAVYPAEWWDKINSATYDDMESLLHDYAYVMGGHFLDIVKALEKGYGYAYMESGLKYIIRKEKEHEP